MAFNREILRAVAMSAAVAVVLGMQLAVADDKSKAADPKFDKLDKNRDGYLSRDEVRSLRDYGKAFDQADENKDGKLDRSEFVKAEAIHDRIVTGKYVDDSLITAKVKAALLREPELNSMDVSVETQGGAVMLSGFVQDDRQRDKAMKVASAVSGVASVKDAMRVK
jgi:hypothetical protein